MSTINRLEREPFTPPSEETVHIWIIKLVQQLERVLEQLNSQAYSADYDQKLRLVGQLADALLALGFDYNDLAEIGVPVDIHSVIGLSKRKAKN